MREALRKHLRDHSEEGEWDGPAPAEVEPESEEEPGRREPEPDLCREVEPLQPQVAGLRDREDRVERRDG